MTELSPARQELLKQAIDTLETIVTGCYLVFSGLSSHPDAEVSSVSTTVLGLIDHHRDILEAMIDGLNATHH